MKNKWSSRLSVGASLMMAIAIFWPDSENKTTQMNRMQKPAFQDLETTLQVDETPALPQLAAPLTLPPPPGNSLDGNNKSGEHPEKGADVDLPAPINKSEPSPSFKPSKILKPSQQPETNAITYKTPLKRKDDKNGQTKGDFLKMLKPLSPDNAYASRDLRTGQVTTVKENSPAPPSLANPDVIVSTTSGIVVGVTAETLSRGRALLRILEHGNGPDIDFAWPDNQGDRNRLFSLLQNCYGMQVALLSGNNRLYQLTDPAGVPWDLNIDRISGFSRLVRGKIADQERQLVYRLNRRHSSIRPARPVRLFPRSFDGALLGGLLHLIGKGNPALQSIAARYKMGGNRLWIGDIRINGHPIPGVVDVSRSSSCKGFGGAA